VPGNGGRGLRITYAVKGLERSLYVSSDRPEELVAAIERARAGGVRVATYRHAAGPRVIEEEFAETEGESDASEKRSARNG
jgi:hypothetical protein